MLPERPREQLCTLDECLGDYALIEVAHEITEPKPLLPIPNQKCLPPYLLTEWSTTRTGQ
jgi:hypothetical protein